MTLSQPVPTNADGAAPHDPHGTPRRFRPIPFLRRLFSWRNIAMGLFWSWNAIFLAFMALGFGPTLLPELISAVRMGVIPSDFLVTALALTLVPLGAVLLALIRLRSDPGRLFTLGYGVEAPLMLLLAIRLFAVRQVTPAIGVLLGVAVLGLVALCWHLIDRGIDGRARPLLALRAIGMTLLLLMGLYASLWIAFYALPLGTYALMGLGEILQQLGEIVSDLWQALLRFNWRDLLTLPWLWMPFWLLGSVLIAYTATLFVLMPLTVPLLYLRAWWHGLRALAERLGWLPTLGLNAAVVGVVALLFGWALRQPQGLAFQLLEQPPSSPTQARALLRREGEIRAGLLNAYLARQRYWSSVGEVHHIRDMYAGIFRLPEAEATQVQSSYETLVRPLLYQPVGIDGSTAPTDQARTRDWVDEAMVSERQEAARLYAAFFDQPLIEGERETVVDAMRATWSLEEARAGWQAVDEREIRLARQEVTVTPRGDWAEMELYEVYENQTAQQQEVVYYFSLPESAVITGIWLGPNADRTTRFAYRVAPRGAAQAVYREEVRRNVDPALVEQIGPRQYRLRAFPVEPPQMEWEGSRSSFGAPPELHLWMTWRVLASEGQWPLPLLAERRNVFWDNSSVRLVNGQAIPGATEGWLPASLPAPEAAARPHRVDFPTGEVVLATPQPLALPSDLMGLRLGVVVDRSRSMANHLETLNASLEGLRALEASGVTVDLYLTASTYRGEAPRRAALEALTADDLLPYGGQNAAELLAQFGALRGETPYDGILVLTDGSGYELGQPEKPIPLPTAPVWMVHLGGSFPIGYDDGTLEAIQASGGSAAASVDEALSRLLLARATREAPTPRAHYDGYLWQTFPAGATLPPEAAALPAEADFGPIAARALILAEMQRQRTGLGELQTLDQLHAIAVEQAIVTPYSSMIVLVNRAQNQRLDELEQGADRFAREGEAIGETAPDDALVTGVPEPEEWLLLGLGAAMLAWYWHRQRGPLLPQRRPM